MIRKPINDSPPVSGSNFAEIQFVAAQADFVINKHRFFINKGQNSCKQSQPQQEFWGE